MTGLFWHFLRDAIHISFDFSWAAELLLGKKHKNHTQETYTGQNLVIVTNDICPNIFILKREISAKKPGVAEMLTPAITESFSAHLHCRLHSARANTELN